MELTLVILPPGKLKYFLIKLQVMIAGSRYPEVRKRAFLTEGKRRVKVQETLLCLKK